MSERFLRSEMLLGPAALDRLARSHVCVVGLGGVGSWAAEVLLDKKGRTRRLRELVPEAWSCGNEGG